MKSKLRAWLWKIFWKVFPPETEVDRIRAMSTRDLVTFVHRIQTGDEPWAEFAKKFCDSCQVTDVFFVNGIPVEYHPCDDLSGECPHGDAVCWWLQQEVSNEDL